MAKRAKARKKDTNSILDEIKVIEDKLIHRRPEPFCKRDFIYAVFGSLLTSLAFVFKGAMVRTVKLMSYWNLLSIVILTILVLTMEIYFISYSRVYDKKNRPFIEFWAKRFFSLYGTSILISMILVFAFAINREFLTIEGVFKVVMTISFPAAVGAAIPFLLRKY